MQLVKRRALVVVFCSIILFVIGSLTYVLGYVKSSLVMLIGFLPYLDWVYRLLKALKKISQVKQDFIQSTERHKTLRWVAKRLGWLHEVSTLKVNIQTAQIHHAVFIKIERVKGLYFEIGHSLADEENCASDGLEVFFSKIDKVANPAIIIKIHTDKTTQFRAGMSVQVRTDEWLQRSRILFHTFPIKYTIGKPSVAELLVDLQKLRAHSKFLKRQ